MILYASCYCQNSPWLIIFNITNVANVHILELLHFLHIATLIRCVRKCLSSESSEYAWFKRFSSILFVCQPLCDSSTTSKNCTNCFIEIVCMKFIMLMSTVNIDTLERTFVTSNHETYEIDRHLMLALTLKIDLKLMGNSLLLLWFVLFSTNAHHLPIDRVKNVGSFWKWNAVHSFENWLTTRFFLSHLGEIRCCDVFCFDLFEMLMVALGYIQFPFGNGLIISYYQAILWIKRSNCPFLSPLSPCWLLNLWTTYAFFRPFVRMKTVKYFS